MVRLPWRTGREGEDPPGGLDVEPTLACEFQDGTLFVYDDHVYIERAGPSQFEDKAIPRDEITEVVYSKGFAIGYLQLRQVGVEHDDGGFLTTPVDENTVHFGRGARGCAERVRLELDAGSAG